MRMEFLPMRIRGRAANQLGRCRAPARSAGARIARTANPARGAGAKPAPRTDPGRAIQRTAVAGLSKPVNPVTRMDNERSVRTARLLQQPATARKNAGKRRRECLGTRRRSRRHLSPERLAELVCAETASRRKRPIGTPSVRNGIRLDSVTYPDGAHSRRKSPMRALWSHGAHYAMKPNTAGETHLSLADFLFIVILK